MNKIAFVTGPIAGIPKAQVKANFDRVIDELKKNHTDVRVPHAYAKIDEDVKWPDYIRKDVETLLECDVLYLCNGWQASKGASLLRDIAIRLAIQTVYN